MSTALQWPALQVEEQRLPRSIDYERAVWGKVHGAPADFRWIARTADFGAGRQDVPRQLNLGAEDVLAHFSAWRNLGDRCHAVTIYPSRAIDAAGRRGFLEKQVLEWRRPPHVPAVFGALLLLPAAARLSDEIWWGRDVPFDADNHLSIDDADHQPLAIDEDTVADAIERGRQTLRETVSRRTLELLYDQLLAGRSPAFLGGLLEPLTAEALAALLLPLPRELADRVSVAGWIPTSRPSFDDLATRWDIVVTAPEQAVPRMPPPPTEQAMEMAEELLATEPAPFRQFVDRVQPAIAPSAVAPSPAPVVAAAGRSKDDRLWPGLMLDLQPPNVEAGEMLKELWEFARAPNRRWLDPRTLKARRLPKLTAQTAEARILNEWVTEVRKQKPDYVHPEQWNVKVDLLRSAAVVLVPEPSTLQKVGGPGSDRVPILLFALMMESPQQWDRLLGLGQKGLSEALGQSARCASRYWVGLLRERLRKWREVRPDVRELIDRAFNSECR